MERREFIALLGMAAAAMPGGAQAEPAHAPDSIASRLVGTWSFASSVNTRKDGSTFDRWGANPSGIFMFDRAGNYAQIIVGSESKVFGAKLAGTSQDRDIVLLTADEFKYSNQATAVGAAAEVLWKRIA